MMPPPWLRRAMPVGLVVLVISVVVWIRVPLLPAIGREFSMSPATLGAVVTVFAAGRLATDLPAGRLANRVRATRLFTWAAMAMFVSSATLAAASSVAWVFGAIFMMGVASAITNTTGMTAISTSAPRAQRGSALALYSASLLLGQAVGPVLGGGVASAGSWRTAMAVGGALALAVTLASMVTVRRAARPGAIETSRRAVTPYEQPLGLLPRLALYGVAFSVFFTLGAMPQTLIPLLGEQQFGLIPAHIGLAIGAGGAARLVSAFLTGFVSDWISRRSALLASLGLQVGGVTLLVAGNTVGWWVLAIVVMSLGSSGYAVGATIVADCAETGRLGIMLGRYRFAGDIGLVTGPGLTAVVYQHSGAATAIAVTAGVLALAAIAASAIPETNPRNDR